MGFGNVYYGLAKRALDQSIASAKNKHPLALTRSMAYHAEVQHAIAEMVIELESIGPHLDRIADDWSNGVNYGAEMAVEAISREVRGS
jgi:alkylation response protein AidB-like acyl-CoA dehydrogenase